MSAFPSLTFPTDPKAHGIFGTDALWQAAVEEERLWMRQHVLVSAASLLEVYLATAITSALWARPEYADRSLAGVREIELIKFPERAPGLKKLIERHAESMLKGDWRVRFRRIEILFGKIPLKLAALEPKLQALQDRRNRIAHNFGQMDKAMRRTPWATMNSIALTVSDVEDSLLSVGHAIRQADDHLFSSLIGSYELLYEFHAWVCSHTDPFTKPSSDLWPRLFRKHIGTQFGTVPHQKYFKALVHYYDACHYF